MDFCFIINHFFFFTDKKENYRISPVTSFEQTEKFGAISLFFLIHWSSTFHFSNPCVYMLITVHENLFFFKEVNECKHINCTKSNLKSDQLQKTHTQTNTYYY